MSHDSPAATVCANCGAPLGGAYCPVCGQKAVGPDVSLHDFFHEAFHEFAHVDGKIVQTLRLLFAKPGMLTKEFLEGRRVRHISPLRLYLTCSVLFFALAAFAPQAERPFFRISKVDNEAGLDPATVQRLRNEATVRANHAIVRDFPRVMFVLMPAFGLLTWVVYRKARPFYAAHLYHAIHFHAFVFLVLALSLPLRFVTPEGSATLAMLAIAVYLHTSLRRVFGGSHLKTALKGAAIGFVYLIVAVATVLAIGIREASF
jgi:hypothetical protein